jgi:hypothetical protein
LLFFLAPQTQHRTARHNPQPKLGAVAYSVPKLPKSARNTEFAKTSHFQDFGPKCRNRDPKPAHGPSEPMTRRRSPALHPGSAVCRLVVFPSSFSLAVGLAFRPNSGFQNIPIPKTFGPKKTEKPRNRPKQPAPHSGTSTRAQRPAPRTSTEWRQRTRAKPNAPGGR